MKKEKLEADKNNILEAYRKSDAEGKKSLENIFGKKVFASSVDWMKSGLDFCKKNKVSMVLPYPKPKTLSEEWHNAAEILRSVVAIKVGDWIPDWNDESQSKWFPYFRVSPFGFAVTYYGSWHTNAGGGSRLCFPTSKMAKETAEEFLAVYEIFYTK